MLANIAFRKMPLASRGLLYTLRLENWVQTPLPSNSYDLAQLLRMDVDEVDKALQDMSAFVIGDKGLLFFPELEDYRQHLHERRNRQSEGGKLGASRVKAKKRAKASDVEGNPQGSFRSTYGSSVQQSADQSSAVELSSGQCSSVSKEDHSEWVDEYSSN